MNALTRGDSETYEAFIEHVCQNDLARVVKLADLEHNMDISRIPHPSENDFRRVDKYRKAHEAIERYAAWAMKELR